ncbi:hypothetical protein I5770_10685 [Brucella sp. BO2]|uniref:hypothetical protein n=1 Tax=Brucella sp. BO2 TaxID=693750 RepID=UPI0002F23689|nr:hypothetical protein [Brucella sp. BO2]QPN29023.1 hypothetical protein I5770_10685 [Brucella sp. BO2]
MISRKTYFTLTKLDVDSHSALRRRDQLPFPSREGRNEYTLFDAFTVLLADDFAQSPDGMGMNRTAATNIVRDIGRLLIECRDEIEAGSELGAANPIFAGKIWGQIGIGNVPFCGTLLEFAELDYAPSIIRHAFVNVSLAFAAFRMRCGYNDVDMTDMWPEAENISSFEDIREKRLERVREAVAKTNEKRRNQ